MSNPLAEDSHDNIFYMYENENRTISGFKYSNSKFVKIWNYVLSENVIISFDFATIHPKLKYA